MAGGTRGVRVGAVLAALSFATVASPLLVAQQPAPGGQPPPTAGLVKMGKAPVSKEVLKV